MTDDWKAVATELYECATGDTVCDRWNLAYAHFEKVSQTHNWAVHEKNRTSGKAGGRFVANGLTEQECQYLCDQLNKARTCFKYRPFNRGTDTQGKQ